MIEMHKMGKLVDDHFIYEAFVTFEQIRVESDDTFTRAAAPAALHLSKAYHLALQPHFLFKMFDSFWQILFGELFVKSVICPFYTLWISLFEAFDVKKQIGLGNRYDLAKKFHFKRDIRFFSYRKVCK